MRPATAADIRLLGETLRDADRKEIEDGGLTVKKALWRSFKKSLWCNAFFVDGDLAVVHGLGGDCISDTGFPWMITTKAAERMPLAFLKIGRGQMARMLDDKPRLLGFAAADYSRACAFLVACGFTLDAPEPAARPGAWTRCFHKER